MKNSNLFSILLYFKNLFFAYPKLKIFTFILLTSAFAIGAVRGIHAWRIQAQVEQVSGTSSVTGQIQQFIPPAPEASAFGKFIETPIGYQTGTPNINIPIHTIQDGALAVPISLSYHASGIKAWDVATWVGAGWNLNAGGQINRVVKGLPDEAGGKGYYHTTLQLNGQPSYAQGPWGPMNMLKSNIIVNDATLKDVANNQLDGEPDIFRFSLPNGTNGTFYINKFILKNLSKIDKKF